MGKKGERGAKDKNAALEEEARNAAKRAEHGEEEYQCTGILEQDFLEICTRAGFQEIPKVIVRPHAHAGITAVDEPDPQAEKEVTNTLAQIQSKYNYFRPSIQVELEHEDPKTTREIFIQSWKIEEKMLTVLAKCLPALSHLQTLRLWKVGLTDLTFSMLLSIFPTCTTLKTLVLEGNPLPERSFYKLISEETNLVHLSLRNNDIDDEAAYLIGQALSSLKSSNKTLASINLSCNHITDVGATHIANGLRLNRSLLSLSLAHNRIGDEGALKIAEILAPFALTHVEVVERRRLLLEKETLERSRLPQRHVELKSERPSSHVSNTAIDKLQTVKTTKDTKKKKDKESAKKEKEKEKEEKEKGQGSGGAVVVSSTTSQAKKEDTKEAKQAKKGVERPAAEQKPSRGKGTKSSNKDKRAQAVEVEVAEPTEIVNPLLEQAEHRDGKVFLPGNRVLIYLNLIRNRITEMGLKGFLAAVEQQTSRVAPGGKGSTGLLRLSLGKNNYPAESKTYARIQELMMARDPLPKVTKAMEEEAAVAF
uniref:Leucine rich repeat containing 71 n=1 Tax=Anolis carolinensis TaxID=28377 RepID=H9GMK5_ANOCA|nr:PREDICTED: leucine-rich repeat-containing protein 71 isoform X3 [Anolis carolinensis]|eukprot:XP_003228443.1 PREDICTED: leucine-rich repeat-containing protein 71 isoform X3 [Anolis carolinensis]